MEFCRRVTLIFISLIVALSCPSISGNALREKRQSNAVEEPKRLVCFYAYWAALRPGEFRFTPGDINANLCTHIVYAYARPQINEGIVPYDFKVDIEDGGWASMVDLKKVNPEATVMLSIGGLFEGSSRFSKMAADIKQRNIFVQSASRELRRYGFEGIDITWLFPGFSEGSTAADKENYVNLIKELREELKDEFVLSISVPALNQYIESGFDITELAKYVDFMNVLAYSYHDSTDATVNHHGPLYSLPNDPGNKDANIDTTIREYLRRGVKGEQMNLVIPLYGVAFALENPNNNDIGAKTEDEGIGLEEPGALIYFELCQRIRKEGWTVKRVNSTAMGPYAFKDRLWVAYDDEDMVRNKARYAIQKRLGGLGFWTVDQDDFKGLCHVTSFPLLRAAREAFLALPSNNQPTTERIILTTPTTPMSEVIISQSLSGRLPKQTSTFRPSSTLSTLLSAPQTSITTRRTPPDSWTSNEDAMGYSRNNAEVDRNIRRKRQAQNDKRIICYYGYWAIYREESNRFTPEDIDPFICTHVLYGYAKPDMQEGIIPGDTNFDIEQKGWERFIALKKKNPELKLMISVGGQLEGSVRFSSIAADPKQRQALVKAASALLRENGFDGIDMSWLYPNFSEGSSSSDKKNYVLLMKELKEELKNDFILSITVPGLKRLLDVGYDIPELQKYVDFFNVWAGAYHESTAPTVNHPSPLYPPLNVPDINVDTVDGTIRLFLNEGVPPAKINLLMALYGLYFVLEDPTETDIGSLSADEEENNEWRGGLVYNELCLKIQKENWTVKRVNPRAMGPYAYKDKHWVAYDDEMMIRNKARYAVEKNLGGIGFWTIDQDDFKGRCHFVSYPLIRGGREAFFNRPSPPDSAKKIIFPDRTEGTRVS